MAPIPKNRNGEPPRLSVSEDGKKPLLVVKDDEGLSVDFDGRLVPYDFGELDELMPAYAMTIHKSQGSEFLAVVIPVRTQHSVMLQRNRLYTGITRGKRLVVLVGTPRAIRIATQRAESIQHCSALRSRFHENQGQR